MLTKAEIKEESTNGAFNFEYDSEQP